MKILSINVSQPTTLAIDNKEVLTAINKKATTGSVKVFTTHIDGDGQADLKNHGGKFKAVYAYGVNHFEHWQQRLNTAIGFGGMGENLSIDQLDEKNIMIGTQYQCGTAILQARLFRQPCFKLGAIYKRPELPAEFIQFGHSGVYFSVEKEGVIEAGMSLEKREDVTQSMSVFDLFDACFQPINEHRKNILKLAVSSPFLPEEWTQKCQRKLQKFHMA